MVLNSQPGVIRVRNEAVTLSRGVPQVDTLGAWQPSFRPSPHSSFPPRIPTAFS